MEEAIAEKKETESRTVDNTQPPTSLTEREAEDRERIAQDLKAGLHPLKVLIFFLKSSYAFLRFILSVNISILVPIDCHYDVSEQNL